MLRVFPYSRFPLPRSRVGCRVRVRVRVSVRVGLGNGKRRNVKRRSGPSPNVVSTADKRSIIVVRPSRVYRCQVVGGCEASVVASCARGLPVETGARPAIADAQPALHNCHPRVHAVLPRGRKILVSLQHQRQHHSVYRANTETKLYAS